MSSDTIQNESPTERKPNRSERKKIGSSVKEILSFAFIVAIIVIPIRTFVAQPFVVNGDSMLPTFHTGEYLIVDQLTYHFSKPQRGDVVIFRYPNNQNRFFIKRVIGMPGETITIDGTDITIVNDDNPGGFNLIEPHIMFQKEEGDNLTQTLADDEYFVMGDNRLASLDSRVWGALPENLIVGRAYFRLLPINQFHRLPGEIKY